MADPVDNVPAVCMRQVARLVAGANGNVPVELLTGVDLAIERGSVTHIVGPSGSGKSTLLRLINRLDEPAAGTIDILGRAMADWPVRQLRRQVAMVLQEPTLLDRTVRENLQLPFDLWGDGLADLDARMHQVMQQVGSARNRCSTAAMRN
jgi:ABC-type methionine transport system ATPase subunit